MTVAVYAGTFDPITCGHIDVAVRAAKLFDKVIVAVAEETYKENYISLPERLYLMQQSFAPYEKIEVSAFPGLLVDYARAQGASVIIRGLRAVSDFEMEFQMAAMNRNLAEDIETVFLTAQNQNLFISSSIIKKTFIAGGKVTGLVPPVVEEALEKKKQGKPIIPA